MIEPSILYDVKCDRCNITLFDNNDICAWYSYEAAKDEALMMGWHLVDNHCYCPNCYTEEDNGNRTVKAPFPHYVQKIKQFMSRIVKAYSCIVEEKDNYFILHGYMRNNEHLAVCDEKWIRAHTGNKFLDIQTVDIGCANVEYIITLRKE